MDEKQLIGKILTLDEGIRYQPYEDTLGNLTIGVGHLIPKDSDFELRTYTDDEMLTFLKADIDQAYQDMYDIFTRQFSNQFNTFERAAVVSMLFNLGKPKFLRFTHMISAIFAMNFNVAAREALNSLWAKQVGARAERIALMMRGQFDEYYDI